MVNYLRLVLFLEDDCLLVIFCLVDFLDWVLFTVGVRFLELETLLDTDLFLDALGALTVLFLDLVDLLILLLRVLDVVPNVLLVRDFDVPTLLFLVLEGFVALLVLVLVEGLRPPVLRVVPIRDVFCLLVLGELSAFKARLFLLVLAAVLLLERVLGVVDAIRVLPSVLDANLLFLLTVFPLLVETAVARLKLFL